MEVYMIILTTGLLAFTAWREYLAYSERLTIAKVNKVKDISELAFMFPDAVPHKDDAAQDEEPLKSLEDITLNDITNGKNT